MQLFEARPKPPNRLSWASRFTILCGLAYMPAGLLLLAWPGAVQSLFGDDAFVGREAALVRPIGMTALRHRLVLRLRRAFRRPPVRRRPVLDRIVLVPLVLVPLILSGVFPHTLSTFAVLDPALALVAWALLSRRS